MPTPLKVVAGREEEIDYYEVAALEKDPACWPDKNHVGSYLLGGTPITPPVEVLLQLPAYGGETAETDGMKVRATNHRSPFYRQRSKNTVHDKLVYRMIDDADHPLKPFVIATCKETICDKPFERFAEAVTRQLFGTNDDVNRLRELSALPSYGKLKFKQPIQPTNRTNVLREGYSYGETPEELAARATEVRNHRREQKKVYREEVERYAHVCANCEATESYSWHMLKDSLSGQRPFLLENPDQALQTCTFLDSHQAHLGAAVFLHIICARNILLARCALLSLRIRSSSLFSLAKALHASQR